MNYLLLIINGNIAVTEVKWWVTESVLDLFSFCMTSSLFIKGDKSWHKYIKSTCENLYHRYSAHGKSFETGIVPVARYSHPLPSALFKLSAHWLSKYSISICYVLK
jgi:hypothetical protein